MDVSTGLSQLQLLALPGFGEFSGAWATFAYRASVPRTFCPVAE